MVSKPVKSREQDMLGNIGEIERVPPGGSAVGPQNFPDAEKLSLRRP